MRRHPSMAVSSILSIAAAMLLAMMMSLVSLNTVHFAQEVERDLQIQISLSPVLNEGQINALQKQIEKLDGVESVHFSDKDQELDSLIDEYGEAFAQYRQSNPLYDVFFITLDQPSLLEPVANEISGLDGVVEVSDGGDTVVRIVEVFDSISLVAWLIIVGFVILGIFLVRNTIAMAIRVRSDEIAIMRHVGAYNFYISTPFILQGMLMGFIGSLVPVLICDLGYLWTYSAFAGQFISSAFSLYPPVPFLVWVSLSVIAGGIILGFAGSWLAVRKNIRSIR